MNNNRFIIISKTKFHTNFVCRSFFWDLKKNFISIERIIFHVSSQLINKAFFTSPYRQSYYSSNILAQ